ncbi:YidC/Oxa1 family membrane protein insertase [Plantactinospora sp. KLBMP9567]|uniref:YidC/Oxa1 family membrane protein insertase n=1 Tax=Plantactinospora sp. KLBMP9567 TaxID=3085900 RepID=UPI002982B077|nr:membrane protein insertase YidC [Plantactinospora sp. KLBMP9567]MDW5330522.1 membrane protein insertase YidC [Plantactinospora sp. KLBMP9567]
MLAFAPLDGAVDAAAHVVTLLAATVEPLAGTGATAAAIVLFTIGIRLLISPLSWAQIRGERRRAALAPRILELRRRHRDQPARLQAELVALHREAGVSPFGNFLPVLAQAPFFFLMYRLFAVPGDAGPAAGAGGLLAERLYGVPLGQHLGDGLAGAAGPVFGVLLGLLVLLAWWSSRRMRRAAGLAGPADTSAGGAEVPGAAVLARLLPLLPYGTVLVALVLPLAAVLYLVTTTAWTGLEQVVLRRG